MGGVITLMAVTKEAGLQLNISPSWAATVLADCAPTLSSGSSGTVPPATSATDSIRALSTGSCTDTLDASTWSMAARALCMCAVRGRSVDALLASGCPPA